MTRREERAKIIGQLAKIMEASESEVDDVHLDVTTALMYAAFEAGKEAK